MNLNELEKKFATEGACRDLFRKMLWPEGPFCPHCDGTKSWLIKTRNIYECGGCRKQYSMTTKTIFHGTKLSFRVWLKALYFVIFSSKGVSSVYLAKWIGVSQKSAWKMIHAIRAAMESHQIQLLPLDGVVELDEKYIGGKPRHGSKPSKVGRGTDKNAVFVAVQRQGNSQAFHIQSLKEIKAIAKTHITRESRIMTDEGRWYLPLSSYFKTHETVNHSRKEYARGTVHNNTAESFASMLERAKQGVYHYISSEHLHHYLAEVVFRWNHILYDKRLVKRGTNAGKVKTFLRVIPFLQQLRSFGRAARCTQVRRSRNCGIKLFPTVPQPVFGL